MPAVLLPVVTPQLIEALLKAVQTHKALRGAVMACLTLASVRIRLPPVWPECQESRGCQKLLQQEADHQLFK